MRVAWKKIRYRLERLALKYATKFLPLLSRKACYRLALVLGSLGAEAAGLSTELNNQTWYSGALVPNSQAWTEDRERKGPESFANCTVGTYIRRTLLANLSG